MAAISSLSHEVLLNIFKRMGTAAQTARCRLVCRQWDSPAEVAMLGCKIVLDSLDKATQLYGHLCGDITKGRYIKHLHFEIDTKDLPLIYKHLLPLAITPTVELLTGTVQPKEFFTTLVQIADNNSTEFSRLEELPDTSNVDNSYMIEAAMRFNFKSLQFTIGNRNSGLNWSIINILEKYNGLETLKLAGYIESWKNLEEALKHCTHLKKLVLHHIAIGDNLSSKEAVLSWVTSNVQQIPSLSTIEFNNLPLRPDLLEYLMYKCSGLVATIQSKCVFSHTGFNPLQRMWDALETVVYKDLTLIFPNNLPVKSVVAMIGDCRYKVDVCIVRYQDEDKLAMRIN